MKKIFNITFTLLAFAALTIACAKEIHDPEEQEVENTAEEEINNSSDEDQPSNPDETNPESEGEEITITATISEDLTKVAFNPTYTDGKPTALTLTWAETDKLLVVDANNSESYSEFYLKSGNGTNEAVFSGVAPPNASSYNVSIKHGDVDASQHQTRDGDTSLLQYIAA